MKKNMHSIKYIATLIDLLVNKGHEPEFEFHFQGNLYSIIAYKNWVDFGECYFYKDVPKPNYSFKNIFDLFNCTDVEGINFNKDWSAFEDFCCLDFEIPIEGTEFQKRFIEILSESGHILMPYKHE